MLQKKMLRDLMENKGAYLACLVIIVLGLIVFSSFSIVLDNLQLSQKEFYSKFQELPGIKQIQGRFIRDVKVLLPNKEQNVYLRLVSYDPDEKNPINGVRLIRGIPLNSKLMNIWVDNKFFDANSLSLNQEIEIIAQGKKRDLRIVGVGRSPEFIYALRTSSDLFPDPETFGIAFVPLEIMENLFPGEAAINDIVFTLKPGAEFDRVKDRLEPKLEPFGLKSIIPRADQTSHMLLSEELKGLEAAARAFPLLFLSIAGMILYIMLKRMIEQQRGQIGILKAFGYTNGEIILHYLSYALIIGALGGITGGLLGIALSFPFTSLYQLFFNMPGLSSRFSPFYFFSSILLSLIFSLFAGYQGCKRILTLQPAEAMRPPAPPIGKKVLLERLGFFWNMLTVQGMMAVRNISRNKGRSIFIFLGITFCFAISGFTWSMNDLVQKMLFDQFEKIEIYDVKISLANPANEKNVSRELYNFPEVKRVETMAEVPVTLKNKWLKKDVALLGLSAESSLYNILDKDGNKIIPPERGILLSQRLADLLNADIGTVLEVNSIMFPENEEDKKLEVVGIIPQYLGVNAYMELNALQNFLEQKNLATSFMVSIDKAKIPELQEKYRKSEKINTIDSRQERLEKSRELMASFGSMIYFYALVGVIIGFAIIYNSSIITLSERGHELASMMVLGMTAKEVLSVVTFEQWFISIFAMLAGIPASKLMLTGIAQMINNDVYTIPTTMTPTAFVLAFAVTSLSIWLAQRAAARKIAGLNLVDVLKSRE